MDPSELFTGLPAFVAYLQRHENGKGEYSDDEFRELVYQRAEQWLEALVVKFTAMCNALGEFKRNCISDAEAVQDASLAAELSIRLVTMKRPVINTLLERYMQILFFDVCRSETPLQLVLPLFKNDEAVKYLGMMMCDIHRLTRSGEPTQASLGRDAWFWRILCENKSIVKSLQVEFMPPDWRGTWTQLMVSIVDELFVPHGRLRWKEGHVALPGRNKELLKVHDEAYVIGHGQLLQNGDRIAYGMRGRIVHKVSKTKVRLKVGANLVDLAMDEVHAVPPRVVAQFFPPRLMPMSLSDPGESRAAAAALCRAQGGRRPLLLWRNARTGKGHDADLWRSGRGVGSGKVQVPQGQGTGNVLSGQDLRH